MKQGNKKDVAVKVHSILFYLYNLLNTSLITLWSFDPISYTLAYSGLYISYQLFTKDISIYFDLGILIILLVSFQRLGKAFIATDSDRIAVLPESYIIISVGCITLACGRVVVALKAVITVMAAVIVFLIYEVYMILAGR